MLLRRHPECAHFSRAAAAWLLALSAMSFTAGELNFQSMDCCKIVSPWRVDVVEISSVQVRGLKRTRYQKQTDERALKSTRCDRCEQG
jgi:hypothetical protein